MLPRVSWAGAITEVGFADVRTAMQDGDIVVCENLRQDEREEANDESLADLIASYGDIFVNDAFAEAHRNHASTLGVAERLPAYAGLTLAVEVNELSKVMEPKRPALFLLGGAKFETKMPLIEKYLELYDFVFIGGALTNDVLKARGLEVGQSLVSDISLKEAPFLWSEKLIVPVDVIVEGPRGVSTKPVDQVLPDEKILDCGPETVMLLERYINEAATILWNGPFGNYEAGFTEGTELTAEIIAKSKAFSVIGGGDTVAAVEKLGLNDKFGFVSIGGGSMLTLLEYGTTPVLELLKK
jgi:phosphoglycerate kinase